MIGKDLKEARKKLGLTQGEFADAIGVTLRGYQKWEYNIGRIRKIHENAIKWVIHERTVQKLANYDEAQA